MRRTDLEQTNGSGTRVTEILAEMFAQLANVISFIHRVSNVAEEIPEEYLTDHPGRRVATLLLD